MGVQERAKPANIFSTSFVIDTADSKSCLFVQHRSLVTIRSVLRAVWSSRVIHRTQPKARVARVADRPHPIATTASFGLR
jgi:hypothetical protein